MFELASMFGNLLGTYTRFGKVVTPTRQKATSDLRRILGFLQEGGQFTLDRFLWQNTNSSFPRGMSTSAVFAELAFIKAEFCKKEDAVLGPQLCS